MPFNGSGTYNTTNPPPFVADTIIEEGQMNAAFTDVAAALSQVLVRDGQAAMTGPLDMGSQSLFGLAAGAAATPSLRWTTGNGFYRSGTDEVSLALGGTQRVVFTTSGIANPIFTGTVTFPGWSITSSILQNIGNTQPVAVCVNSASHTGNTSFTEFTTYTSVVDRGSHMNESNGRFTAPVAGVYFVSGMFRSYQAAGIGAIFQVRVNGTSALGQPAIQTVSTISGNHDTTASGILVLAANDYVSLWGALGTSSDNMSAIGFHIALLY